MHSFRLDSSHWFLKILWKILLNKLAVCSYIDQNAHTPNVWLFVQCNKLAYMYFARYYFIISKYCSSKCFYWFQDEKSNCQNRSSGKNTVTISINAQPNSQSKQDSSRTKSVKQEPFYLHLNGNSHTKTNHEADHAKETTRKISTTVINQTFSSKNGIKIEDFSNKSSVSFNLNHAKDKMESKMVTVIPTNGILKNGVGGNLPQMQIHPSQANRSPCKSIKFAGM